MIDIDGVIGRLMQLMQDAHLTLGKGCCREYRITEMVFRDHLRTRECEENAALLNLLESLLIQACVAFQRIMQGTTVLGEGGRVEDDEIVTGCWLLAISRWLSYALQELKGILAEGLVARVIGE